MEPTDNKEASQSPLDLLERIRVFWRSVGLQLANQWTPWRRGTEKPKVVIYKDRWIALSHCILHIPPLAGAMTLIALNASHYYIGGPIFYGNASLQFVAKIHEVWMQASLSIVLLSFVRAHLLGSGAPFGILFAPSGVSNVSYLWSLEYWSSVTSGSLRGWRRVVLIVVVTVTIILAALVGPSSAVAMIPRLVTIEGKPLSGSKFLNEAPETPFPYDVNSSATLNLDYDQLHDAAYMDESYKLDAQWASDHHRYTIMRNYTKYTISTNIWLGGGGVLASFPSQFVSTFLASLRMKALAEPFWSNYKYLTTRSYQPVTFVRCTDSLTVGPLNMSTTIKFPDRVGEPSNDAVPLRLLLRSLANRGQSIPEDPKLDELKIFPPFWLVPSSQTEHSLLGITGQFRASAEGRSFVVDPATLESDPALWVNVSARLHACNIDAFWALTDYKRTHEEGMATVTASLASPKWKYPKTFSHSRKIRIDPQWADKLGDHISNLSIPLNGFYKLKADGIDRKFDPLAEVLAAVFSNALSNFQSGDESLPTLRMQNGERDDPAKPNEDLYNNTLIVRAFNEGQGYNLFETSVILALVVLSIYCILVIIYIIYILSFATVSSAWNSAAEFAALALCSPRPSHLGPVTAGIESLATFREPVRIRANKGGELELEFLNDGERGSRVMRRVVWNCEY